MRTLHLIIVMHRESQYSILLPDEIITYHLERVARIKQKKHLGSPEEKRLIRRAYIAAVLDTLGIKATDFSDSISFNWHHDPTELQCPDRETHLSDIALVQKTTKPLFLTVRDQYKTDQKTLPPQALRKKRREYRELKTAYQAQREQLCSLCLQENALQLNCFAISNLDCPEIPEFDESLNEKLAFHDHIIKTHMEYATDDFCFLKQALRLFANFLKELRQSPTPDSYCAQAFANETFSLDNSNPMFWPILTTDVPSPISTKLITPKPSARTITDLGTLPQPNTSTNSAILFGRVFTPLSSLSSRSSCDTSSAPSSRTSPTNITRLLPHLPAASSAPSLSDKLKSAPTSFAMLPNSAPATFNALTVPPARTTPPPQLIFASPTTPTTFSALSVPPARKIKPPHLTIASPTPPPQPEKKATPLPPTVTTSNSVSFFTEIRRLCNCCFTQPAELTSPVSESSRLLQSSQVRMAK